MLQMHLYILVNNLMVENRILTWRYHYNRNTALYYGHSNRAGNSCRQRSCRQISGFCRYRQCSFQTFTGHTGLLLITLNVAGTVPATFTRHTPLVPARGKPCRDGPTFYFLGLTYHQENLIFAGTVPWPSLSLGDLIWQKKQTVKTNCGMPECYIVGKYSILYFHAIIAMKNEKFKYSQLTQLSACKNN